MRDVMHSQNPKEGSHISYREKKKKKKPQEEEEVIFSPQIFQNA